MAARAERIGCARAANDQEMTPPVDLHVHTLTRTLPHTVPVFPFAYLACSGEVLHLRAWSFTLVELEIFNQNERHVEGV